MSLGGTSPSTFLFLLGRAHAIPEVVEGIIVPAANRGAGDERVRSGFETWACSSVG